MVNVDTHIGQYKILKTIGAGGMGTVYLGEHILLGRRAAIKTLLPALSSHREIIDRFFNEAKAISAINDPGVVQIFDFGYHVDGTAFIVMEYLEGESLAARLDRLGSLSVGESLRIARQIAASLAATHALGIIHRDLKPANVFLIRDPEAQDGERTKILDFGICKLDEGAAESSVTQTGQMLGTPVYMSPEQCRGAGKIDHRSDIYSVGCALYHMLTGQPPFDCESVGDFIAAHLKDEPPPPSEIEPSIPPLVDSIVMRCLAKEPEYRFQTMEELHATIERALSMISDHGLHVRAKPITQHVLTKSRGEWFVDSWAVPPPEPEEEWEARPPQRSGLGRIFALAAALFLGIVVGMQGMSYALDDKTPADQPPPPVAASIDEPQLADMAAASEVAPPEEVAEDMPNEVTVEPPKVEPPKVARPPRPREWKPPQPRRHVPLEENAPQQDNEDLYDAR